MVNCNQRAVLVMCISYDMPIIINEMFKGLSNTFGIFK